jgi:2-amino-4-hydroxy-6-hydroxymethyldihydropteridine diphosphokinase
MVKVHGTHTAWLLIGGNMGHRMENLANATSLIEKYCGSIGLASSVYETEAWGKEDQPPFLNQALEINTSLAARQLLSQILAIEKKMGRSRTEKFGPRHIDIDILFFDDEIINKLGLDIPHPRIQDRRFVLVPLAEIAAEKIHPAFKITVRELLKYCTDPLQVSLYRE